MCGRFTITDSKDDLEEYFKVKVDNSYKPRYNAAPSQLLPVILNEKPDEAQMVRWGLKPVWFNPERKDGLINVRAETLRDKHTFKADLERRRCLILADGFYEWQTTKEGKQPYRISFKDNRPFAFAGIWEENMIDGEKVRTFAIITTTPNGVLLPIHTRMPVILSPEAESEWLATPNLELLRPYTGEEMEAYGVGKEVNVSTNESPLLIERNE